MFRKVEGIISFEDILIALVHVSGVVVGAAPVVVLNPYL